MPIRMVEDDPGGSNNNSRNPFRGRTNTSGAGKIGGGLGNIIAILLPFLIKRPKLLLALILIGGGVYFFVLKPKGTGPLQETLSQFVRGGELNKEIYEETEIYEALADNKKNPLPEKVSLMEFCPSPLNQGSQGSCVAWASAYAARTILEAQRTGKDPNSVRFSPSFLYNQIALQDCQGAYVKYAMDNMLMKGGVFFSDFKYSDQDCSRQPDGVLLQKAKQFKIKGFQRLTEESKGKNYELLAMKQNLAKGSPVVIGMMVGGSFMSNMQGREIWKPTESDYDKNGFGGHAMCVVGYDDYLEGGSFLLMNSWGKEWGKGGFAWVRYSDFRFFNVEAYGLYPMGNANEKQFEMFICNFGLELNNGKKRIALVKSSENVDAPVFETALKLSSTDKFKIELTNNIECFIYVFGEETNGSVYTLFPYTPKHSPYCGITGTRLFPRDYSLVPDKIGTKDRIAVVISFEPLNYEEMTKKINVAQGSNFAQKIKSTLKTESKATFTQENTIIKAEQKSKDKEPLYFIIEARK